jgi:hypothetical protein
MALEQLAALPGSVSKYVRLMVQFWPKSAGSGPDSPSRRIDGTLGRCRKTCPKSSPTGWIGPRSSGVSQGWFDVAPHAPRVPVKIGREWDSSGGGSALQSKGMLPPQPREPRLLPNDVTPEFFGACNFSGGVHRGQQLPEFRSAVGGGDRRTWGGSRSPGPAPSTSAPKTEPEYHNDDAKSLRSSAGRSSQIRMIRCVGVSDLCTLSAVQKCRGRFRQRT